MNGKTKRVNGTDLASKYFLWAPDPENTDGWVLPVLDPTSSAKTQNLLKNHLARFAEMKSIPPAERARLWERLIGACIANGITVGRTDVPAETAPLAKPEPVDPELKRLLAMADRQADLVLAAMGLE
jgi:hypothetical protein